MGHTPKVRVLLDGEPIPASFASFADAIAGAAARAEASGRLITDVLIDGRPATDGELQNPAALVEPPGEVSLTSARPRDLVRATLLHAVDALDQIDADHQAAAHCIARGELDEAVEPLQSALQTWDAVRQALAHGATLSDLPPGASATLGLGRLTHDLANNLQELRDALSRQDWSEVADLLLDELTQSAARWRASLTELVEFIGPPAEEPT